MWSKARLVCLYVTASIAFGGARAGAQGSSTPTQWIGSMDAGVVLASPDAKSGGLGTGGEIAFSGGIRFSRFVHAGADLGVVVFSDDNGFTNNTNLGTKSSSTNGLTSSAWIGLLSPRSILSTDRRVEGGINAGVSFVNVTREIGSCIGCDSQTLGSSTSPFVEPMVLVTGGDGKRAMRFSVRRYLSSEYPISTTLQVGVFARR